MKDDRLKQLKNDEVSKALLNFIPNNLGINLCAVDDIKVIRQDDGQLVSVRIIFLPNND